MSHSYLLRSMLFVPGHNRKLLESAVRSGADALILDIEDSVRPDNQKQVARAGKCVAQCDNMLRRGQAPQDAQFAVGVQRSARHAFRVEGAQASLDGNLDYSLSSRAAPFPWFQGGHGDLAK